MADKHTGELLMEAINDMDVEIKGIVTGYYYNQLSIPELAEINSISPGEIYKILTGVRESLIKALKENGVRETEYPKSLATELFLTYGEGAVSETREGINHE